MQESLLIVQKIKAMYQHTSVSRADSLIGDYILNNPDCLTNATAYSLAEATGTSPATIVRFCRKLGFSGFSDFKNNASNYIVDNAHDMSLKRGNDVATVKSKVISYNKMILDQLEQSLENDALARAAELIAGARRVLIVSEGGSGTISRAAYDIFMKLAIPCSCVEDIMFQVMELSMLDKDDVVFIIVNSGRTWNVLENAAYARERGLKVIGMVGLDGTPLSKYLDVEIHTNVFSSDYFSDISSARACELVTVSILHSIIALTRTEEQMERSREIGLSLERKRIPPK